MRTSLQDSWFLICSKDINDCGEAISTAGYKADKWYRAKVPGTVFASLVEDGCYDDPYYGLNLMKLPGYKKRRDINFSLQKKPHGSPFRKSWWYRTEFIIENKFEGERIWLNFRGINYSANIWLNGKKIAGADDIKGTFRLYDFDVTDFIISGQKNALAVEVFSPGPDALALTFIDWAPAMPDDNMGIWQPVILYSTGPAALKNTFVSSKVNTDELSESKPGEAETGEAELKIETEVINTQNRTLEAEIELNIEDINIIFKKNVTLNPLSTEKFVFTCKDFPDLKIKNPRMWWPYQLGKPELYKLKLNLKVKNYRNSEESPEDKERDEEKDEGKYIVTDSAIPDSEVKDNIVPDIIVTDGIVPGSIVSDSVEVTFGIRDIKAVLNEYGVRLFIINGRKLLIRGAAWTPDLMLRQSKRQDEIDTDFIVNLNLNAVRLEGKLATDYFWELCDRKGILVIAGWPCCNYFEKWGKWKCDDVNIAAESERSQILRLRNHPSFAAWLYGSDFPPPENVEKVYLGVLKETYSNLPAISSASHKISKLTGISGVKMTGPYSYVPPVYWYDKKRPGYAEGFNTETCPDACIPIIESIKKMLPPDQLFVGSRAWNHHTGLGEFSSTKYTDKAISKRYGKPVDINDYSKTAQLMGYESWRAMYEAHNRNFPLATGVIGWKLNSPWPSLIWQLYDYYMNPLGAFFGTKKACEPLHIQYSYDDHSIWIINNELKDYQNLEAIIKIYNFDLTEKLSVEIEVNIKKESRKKIYILPEIDGLSEVYFLRLYVKNNEANNSVSDEASDELDNTVDDRSGDAVNKEAGDKSDDNVNNVVNDDGIKSSQLYWLTTSKDIFTGTDLWYYSPLKAHADMSLIRKMPRTGIEVSLDPKKIDCNYYVDITIKNPGNYIAFFIWIKLYDKKTGEIIAPVFWSDNCISLFPGETIKIKGIISEDIILKDKTYRHEGVESAATGNYENSSPAGLENCDSIDERIIVKAEGWNC